MLDGLTENPRVVIRGSAGTGKTLLAIEEARRQRALGNRVLLCCFNQMLAAKLSDLEDLEGVDVHHFHGLLGHLIDAAGLQDRLPDATPDELFRVFMPSVTLEAILELDNLGAYDVLVVDEGQDLLLPDYIDVLDALLDGGWAEGRWRVFLDPHQDLFGAKKHEGCRPATASRHHRVPSDCELQKHAPNRYDVGPSGCCESGGCDADERARS